MRPRLQAELSVEARSAVRRTPASTWTVTTATQLVVLNGGLEPIGAFPLDGAASGIHAVAPNSRRAALSLADRVAMVDPSGRGLWEVVHRPWPTGRSGSTWVTPDGLVWAVTPGHDGAGSPDRWWVMDADTGALLADLALDGQSCGSEPIGHAGVVLLGLSTPGGDDGSRIYAGRHDGSGTTLLRLPGNDRVLADLHRRGDRYLTTHRDHEDVAVHSLDDGAILVSRAADEVFGADDFIDFHGAFVTEDRVVVRSVLEQEHVVLDAATLTVIGPVEYPDGAARDAVLSADEGRWVTTDWLDGRVQLWSL